MKKTLLSLMMLCASFMLFAKNEGSAGDYSSLNPLVTGVPSLSINPDAVGGGMGDVGVSTSSDINSQFWNSSKYAQNASNAGFAFSYTPWLRRLGISDINLAYLAGYYTPSKVAGTISASLRYFSLGQVVLRESPDAIGITANPYEIAFDLGYSRILAENFSMGVVLRMVASDLSAKNDPNYYTGYAFAADINGYYNLPIDIKSGTSYFRFGFNISNLGTRITYDKGDNYNLLPLNLRLGFSYLVPFDDYNRLQLSLETNRTMVPSRLSRFTEGYDPNDESTWSMSADQYNNISVMRGLGMSWCDAPGGFAEEMKEFNWAAGLEYAYNEQFFARFGYNNEARVKGNRKYFTFGVGFRLSAFKLDVGYVLSAVQSNPLDQTLRFSLAFDVDGIKALADRNK